MKKLSSIATAMVALSLVGCGGGGGGGGTSTTPSAEGVYSGTLTSNGTTGVFSSVVLEDSSLWAIYGVAGTGGSTLVQGFVAASGTSTNGTYSATGKDYGNTGAVLNTTLNGTYSPGVSIAGTTNSGGTFSGTTANVTGYNYNTPAQVSTIVGSWSGSSLFGNATSVSIVSSGAYTGTSGTCAISGTLMPRASGKNIFNVTYTNGVTGCNIPNLSAQGIGIASTLNNGKTQLIIALTTADKSVGTVAFITK